MKIDIEIKFSVFWVLFVIYALLLGTAVVAIYKLPFDVIVVVCSLCFLLALILFYVVHCSTEIAKKALELHFELVKNNNATDLREKEDEAYVAAAKTKEYEMSRVNIVRSIRVEVADV